MSGSSCSVYNAPPPITVNENDIIPCTAVIGSRWGDEGKGKVVAHLLKEMIKEGHRPLCVRYNGGPNAGHTIYVDDPKKVASETTGTTEKLKVVTHMIPSGIVLGVPCYIGPMCLVDMAKLNTEIVELEKMGFTNIRENLYMDTRAHIITSDNIEEDQRTNTIGTTNSGIGPTASRKCLRTGTRVVDVSDNDEYKRMCKYVTHQNVAQLFGFLKCDMVFYEGAQGYMLDPNFGTYPYCTSTDCTIMPILSTGNQLGLYYAQNTVYQVWAVAKMYDTYVGTMEFQPKDDIFNRLQMLGKEFGATTGRARQCNWLNLSSLVDACRQNYSTHLVINKCDIIDELGVYKLYDISGELKEFDNLNDMKDYIYHIVVNECSLMTQIIFSSSPNDLS